MKKILFSLLCLAVAASQAMGQAKKPTIMVVPSDAWCNENGYVQTYDDMGISKTVSDYKAALTSDMDLKLVIAKINELMADRGFPLKDMEATLANIERAQAEEMAIVSKTSGSSVAESLLDRLRRVAKADIIIEIGWTLTQQGPRNTLTYVMRGMDSYSNKQIAGSSGASQPSISAATVSLLEEAVLSRIDEFNDRLQAHFDDMFENGREVALDLRVFDNGSGIDFESEYGDMELCEIIDEWMAANTVMGRFTKLDGTETRISYDQVRIPLFKENGTAMDTEGWARQLRNVLRKEPYLIPVKVVPNGLGRCTLILGEK
jgi:hypothetical protein